MLYDQRRKRSRQSMGAVPRAPASSRPAAAAPSPALPPPPSPLPPLVRAHTATARFLEALPRHSRREPVWGSSTRVRSVLTRTSADQRVVVAASSDTESSWSPPRSSFTATDAVSTALVVTTTMTSDESAMVYLPPTPFELQQRADVRKLIRRAHRARKLLLDRLMIVNLRRNHRCELMEEIARLKKVLASLQEQVDTTTRNVATMDRLVQHLQTISSIFTDATQVPDATVLPAAAASLTESTTEAAALTLDAEATRSRSRSPSQSPSQSPRSPTAPGAARSGDEEEKEASTVDAQQRREKEQNRERRQKEEKSNEAQVGENEVEESGGSSEAEEQEEEEERGGELDSAPRASPRAAASEAAKRVEGDERLSV